LLMFILIKENKCFFVSFSFFLMFRKLLAPMTAECVDRAAVVFLRVQKSIIINKKAKIF